MKEESQFIRAALEVIGTDRFRVRPTHRGFEVYDTDHNRTLEAHADRNDAAAVVARKNTVEAGLRLAWTNPDLGAGA